MASSTITVRIEMPKRNPRAECQTCPFWMEYEKQPDTGRCRRFPPSAGSWIDHIGEHSEIHNQQPDTGKYEVCGEHPQFFTGQ